MNDHETFLITPANESGLVINSSPVDISEPIPVAKALDSFKEAILTYLEMKKDNVMSMFEGRDFSSLPVLEKTRVLEIESTITWIENFDYKEL